MNPTQTSTQHMAKVSAAWALNPNTSTDPSAAAPPSASTTVYLNDILTLQYRHLPLSLTHDIIGIISEKVKECPQAGHLDLPRMKFCPLGSRYMTTFRKLNIMLPRMKIKIPSTMPKNTSILPPYKSYYVCLSTVNLCNITGSPGSIPPFADAISICCSTVSTPSRSGSKRPRLIPCATMTP